VVARRPIRSDHRRSGLLSLSSPRGDNRRSSHVARNADVVAAGAVVGRVRWIPEPVRCCEIHGS
jgi:hypothetical protein